MKTVTDLEDEIKKLKRRAAPTTPEAALQLYAILIDNYVQAAEENQPGAKAAIASEIAKLGVLIESLRSFVD